MVSWLKLNGNELITVIHDSFLEPLYIFQSKFSSSACSRKCMKFPLDNYNKIMFVVMASLCRRLNPVMQGFFHFDFFI